MSDTGLLRVCVRLAADQSIAAVELASSRPQVSRLLSGRPPGAALSLAGLLFQVCRQAQTAAAEAALVAAGGLDRQSHGADPEARVACEVVQEHLWRLLLDWPALLDQLPQTLAFQEWHAALRGASLVETVPQRLLAAVEQRWLGGTAAEWLALASLEQLQDWCRCHDSPAARLCAGVAALDQGSVAPVQPALLAGAFSAAAVRADWGRRVDDAFTQLPHCDGAPCETGVLAWQVEAPLLRDVLLRRPARVLARVLARLRDTLQILAGQSGPRIDASADGVHGGLALVRTARGLLLHQVRVAADQVSCYRVVAPTEWNFHPAGPLASGLRGVRIAEPGARLRWVRAQLLSLDPCVESVVEFCHA